MGIICSLLSLLRKIYKVDIGYNVRISWRARLDLSINPSGIHIGDNTLRWCTYSFS